jgi:hypothetical protein
MSYKKISETSDEYYKDTVARINTILGNQSTDLWRMVIAAKQDYILQGPHIFVTFWDWLDERWGLQRRVNDDGSLSIEITVADEKKYALFILKYS